MAMPVRIRATPSTDVIVPWAPSVLAWKWAMASRVMAAAGTLPAARRATIPQSTVRRTPCTAVPTVLVMPA